MIQELIKPQGVVNIKIFDKKIKENTENIELVVKNNVVLNGRIALAKSLANDYGEEYNFFISRMLLGDGGTYNGSPRYVDSNRNGLFGVVRLSKPVIATTNSSRVTFTTVVSYDEAVGVTLNEIALQMNTGDLYSMATFADLNKTDSMQITINWELYFV